MSADTPTSLGASIRNGALSLGVFAIVTATAISLTYVAGSDAIAANKAAAKARALEAVMSPALYDQSLLASPITLAHADQLDVVEHSLGYAAIKNHVAQGIVLPVVAKDGYSGDISMLVGLSRDGVIQGVRVLEHKETPGLGDKVERKKSAWIDGFIGHSLTNTTTDEWAVTKDGGLFDGFTGATITPRAVVSAVHKSLRYHEQQQSSFYPNTQAD